MYQEKDFTACIFNPFAKGKMLKAYPRLQEIAPQDHDTLPLFDPVLRYICFLYDPKSPLIIGERDLNYRKSVAATLAGFDVDGDDEFLQALYEAKIEWAVTLIMRYLMRFVKQRKWAMIVAVEMAYWEAIQRIMQPVKKGTDVREWDELKAVEIKAKLKDEAEKDLKRLDVLYNEFFGEDETLSLSAQKHRITPEMIASGSV